MDYKEIATKLFADDSRQFRVRLWDGKPLEPDSATATGELVLSSPESLRLFLPPISEAALAAAYATGEVDLDGDLVGLIERAADWRGPAMLSVLRMAPGLLNMRPRNEATVIPFLPRLGGLKHRPKRDRQAIGFHYDKPKEFYELFLDPSMAYSCAYFPTGRESLPQAQAAKLELICRKLALKPGERLLDIGCGWGSLLFHAHATREVSTFGITLSAEQLRSIQSRLAVCDFGGKVEAHLIDYRELAAPGSFDKIASVGMMEHVGAERLGTYFRAAFDLLRPGGLFLNHAIADIDREHSTLPWFAADAGRFIDQFVFPDSALLPIQQVIEAAEEAGFEVRDLESLREHYGLTLERWLDGFESNFDRAVDLVGKPAARIWRLYLACSAAAFRLGRISVFQLLLAKRDAGSCSRRQPMSRGAWYTPDLCSPAESSAQRSTNGEGEHH